MKIKRTHVKDIFGEFYTNPSTYENNDGFSITIRHGYNYETETQKETVLHLDKWDVAHLATALNKIVNAEQETVDRMRKALRGE